MQSSRLWMIMMMSAILMLSPSVQAGDGVTDIAPNGTSTFVISTPGSYRLVRDVTMTTAAICISIAVDNVTLDLNGHTVTGTPGGSSFGVSSGAGLSRIKVFNGTVVSFALVGIGIANDSIVEDCIVKSCGDYGIGLELNGRIINCTVTTTAEMAIHTGTGGLVSNCRVNGAGTNGIEVGANSIVENCLVTGANSSGGYNGILANKHCIVRGNTVSDTIASASTSAGIIALERSQILNNVVTGTTSPTSVSGISTGDYCHIIGNTASKNDGGSGTAYGINAAVNSIISDNIASENTSDGTVHGIDCNTGSQLFRNQCYGNFSSGSGSAFGIYGDANCEYVDNIIRDNSAGPTGSGSTRGLDAGANCQIRNNTILSHFAITTNGTVIGITSSNDCIITGNLVSGNGTTQNGSCIGIQIGSRSRVTDNNVTNNTATGAGLSTGISSASGTGAYIADNSTTTHDTGRGIVVSSFPNVVERNRCQDGFTIHASNPAPTADNANIDY